MFWIICVMIEYIVVYCLGMKLPLINLFWEDFFQCAILYSLIILSIFIINYIYNFFIIKSLNNKIEILKKRKEEENNG